MINAWQKRYSLPLNGRLSSTTVEGAGTVHYSPLLTSPPGRSTRAARISNARLPRRTVVSASSKSCCAGSKRKRPNENALPVEVIRLIGQVRPHSSVLPEMNLSAVRGRCLHRKRRLNWRFRNAVPRLRCEQTNNLGERGSDF